MTYSRDCAQLTLTGHQWSLQFERQNADYLRNVSSYRGFLLNFRLQCHAHYRLTMNDLSRLTVAIIGYVPRLPWQYSRRSAAFLSSMSCLPLHSCQAVIYVQFWIHMTIFQCHLALNRMHPVEALRLVSIIWSSDKLVGSCRYFVEMFQLVSEHGNSKLGCLMRDTIELMFSDTLSI